MAYDSIPQLHATADCLSTVRIISGPYYAITFEIPMRLNPAAKSSRVPSLHVGVAAEYATLLFELVLTNTSIYVYLLSFPLMKVTE